MIIQINKQLADPEFQEIVDDTLAREITSNYVEKLALRSNRSLHTLKS